MRRDRFRIGRSTFKCCVCGHNTRDAGDNEYTDMCPICYEFSGMQNSVYDGCFLETDRPYRDDLLRKMEKRGGNVEKVRQRFKTLFEA